MSERAWHIAMFTLLAGLIVATGLLGLVVVPIVQGQSEGLGVYTAICRALGIGTTPAAAPLVAAPTATKVAWTEGTFAALERGHIAAGQKLAEERCVACHAADGSSPDPSIPRLASQRETALFKELQDYKSGARTNETMTPLAQALSEQEMADVAAYYASLRLGLSAAHPSFEGPEIEALALRGDPSRALPPCASCHGAGGEAPTETPNLTGDPAPYVTAQLQAFAKSQRTNDIFARMRTIAAKLTPREMELLGDYYTTPH
jgi:cytochrome c553